MEPRCDIALVPLEADLDITTVGSLRHTIDSLIDGGCRRIILNMAGASYIDSAGMAMILVEIRRMRSVGGLISITNASGRVMAILRRARVVDFAPVSSTTSQRRVPELDPATQPLWRTVVPVDECDLALTRSRVESLLKRLPLSPDERFDAFLAVGEAMGNAVDHAGGCGALVAIAGYPDRAVIEVTDCGDGFDLSGLEEVGDDPCAERGRGIKLMRLLADAVTIGPKPSGTGTLVRIVKLAHAGTD